MMNWMSLVRFPLIAFNFLKLLLNLSSSHFHVFDAKLDRLQIFMEPSLLAIVLLHELIKSDLIIMVPIKIFKKLIHNPAILLLHRLHLVRVQV
jgi:hypothetical protein